MAQILSVDDDLFVTQHLDYLITSFGYKPLSTLFPKYLFHILETESVDLILMDVNMPELDGVTLLKQVKAHPQFHMVPVIMLTGHTEDDLLEECFSIGAADFLHKPIKEVILKSRIESVLRTQTHINEIKVMNELLNASNQELEYVNEELRIAQDELIQTARLALAESNNSLQQKITELRQTEKERDKL